MPPNRPGLDEVSSGPSWPYRGRDEAAVREAEAYAQAREAERDRAKFEGGRIGGLIGTGTQARIVIGAGFGIVFFVFLMIVYFAQPPTAEKSQMMQYLGGLLAVVIGFLFGTSLSKSD